MKKELSKPSALSECNSNNGNQPLINCYNGSFVGSIENNGIMSFKGIPFAKAPIGKLRWKAPVPVEKSVEACDATRFGKSCIQSESSTETASKNPEGLSDDCLTLNIWTSDLIKKNKPIMFYIHGGAFGWGGTSDPLYNGKFIVKEHPEVIVVTCNYRIGILGFADFSEIEGGEEYPDAGYLGILDIIEGLKWVQQNATAFYGDPNNITIFGESAGGGIVSILMCMKETEGLFNRAIAQSGCVNFTYQKSDYKKRGQMDRLYEMTGAKNMNDLIAISDKDLLKIYTELDENGKCLGDINNLPLRGENSPIPEDLYGAIERGVHKDTELIIGTTADECRYFIDGISEPSIMDVPKEELEEFTLLKFKTFEYAYEKRINRNLSILTDEEKENVNKFFERYQDDRIWQLIEFANEYAFRLPAYQFAYNHSKAGGKTYMYYFGKENTNNGWIKACHASELSYVFHNLEDTIFCGEVIEDLADRVCGAWTNFAITGNPSSEEMKWDEFACDNQITLVINNDCTSELKKDFKQIETNLLLSILKYYFAM